MCGISGFVSVMPRPGETIFKMNDLLRHRGPDDEGYLLTDDFGAAPAICGGPDTPEAVYRSAAHVPVESCQRNAGRAVRLALGHRRLSIVDLSPLGHQPMSFQDQRFWIVYNGEIYNHVELRLELEELGCRFLSASDTEVILAAYSVWGQECLHRFNGMWAFAIYDTVQRSLFLARDRFGVKPLYYWINGEGTLGFASEIKALTVMPGWRARCNPERVYDFLAWGIQDHTDETLFEGVYQLLPGHCCTLPLGGNAWKKMLPHPGGRLPARQWYELKARPFAGDAAAAAEGVRDLLTDSVRLRLRADVPVGSCLSGGLDSSSIVCIANGLLRAQSAQSCQKTFSACSDVARFDERTYMEDVVAKTGVDAHYCYPDQDELFRQGDALAWHQDEPFGSTSIYAQWTVFKLASDNSVRVMLDGQGSDELLAGYHNFLGARLAGLARRFRMLELMKEWRAMGRRHGYDHYHLLQLGVSNLMPWLVRPVAALQGRTCGNLDWLDLVRLGATRRDPITEAGARSPSIREISLAQLTRGNIQMLLHWEDRNSMAHSIESRVPFLDYRLVEFALGLPDEFKIREGVTKSVLRDAMKGILPERIGARMDKLGFTTPEEVWIRERSTVAFRRAIEGAIALSNGVLTQKALTIFDEVVQGKRPFHWFIWRVISFGTWLRTFQVEAGPRSLFEHAHPMERMNGHANQAPARYNDCVARNCPD